MRTLFSIAIWLYWAVCMVVFFSIITVVYVVTFPSDRLNRGPNRLLKGLAWVMMKINPGWRLDISGTDPAKIEKPAIVVANHQSFLDMPLLYLLPWTMKWVAKKSLFRIPILGWIIAMTGHIGIDRQSRRSVKKLDKLVRPIQRGIPGMIFPEGTRTLTGELKPFKNGAFVLAKQYNFKVLPVVLDGGYEAMPTGAWRITPRQRFCISVLEPLDPGAYESAAELKTEAFREIKNELNRIRDNPTSVKDQS